MFSLVRARWVQVVLLCAAVFLVYGNTLDVPFYFDDQASIVENKAVRSLGDWHALWNFSPARFVCYLTFAVNYHFHGLDVAGYHFVNLFIHFLAGTMFLLLAGALLETPALRDYGGRKGLCLWFPLFAALLFVVHPLQTQAVTYVVQRAAGLAALFYITAMFCYLRARLGRAPRSRALWAAATALAALLAFFTKQHTATLPLALLLLEMIFFPAGRRHVLLLFGALFLAVAGIYAFLKIGLGYSPFSLEAFDALTRETKVITRTEYLATQTLVLWKYLQLFIWPAGLHLDHDFPLQPGFSAPVVLAAAGAHVFFIGCALFFSRKNPLPAFAVLFYYLAHGVESGLIPIRDVLFEHRTYLPNLGLCLLFSWLLFVSCAKESCRQGILPAAAAIVLALGVISWQRHAVWQDPARLWQDSVQKSPLKARPRNNLGVVLDKRGDVDTAILYYKEAMRLEPDYIHAYLNLGVALNRKGEYEEAARSLRQGLQIDPHWPELLFNMGRALAGLEKNEEAKSYYQRALQMDDAHAQAHNNLANILYKEGKAEEAASHYEAALRLDPSFDLAAYNLGAIMLMRGDYGKAEEFLRKTVQINAGFAEAHHLLGRVAAQQGNVDEAMAHYQRALAAGSAATAVVSYDLACLYALQGREEEAGAWLDKALAAGYDDWGHIGRDADLDMLRVAPCFQELRKRWPQLR